MEELLDHPEKMKSLAIRAGADLVELYLQVGVRGTGPPTIGALINTYTILGGFLPIFTV